MAEKAQEKQPADESKEREKRIAMLRAVLPKALIVIVVLIALLYTLTTFTTAGERCANAFFGSFRDDCYLNLAKESNDISFCAKIQKEATRNLCYATIGGFQTGVSCSFITEPLIRDQCYTSAAQTNSTLCGQIALGPLADTCYNTAATSSSDPALCRGIKDDGVRLNCQVSVVSKLAADRQDSSLCQQLALVGESGSQSVDSCLLQFSRATSDKSICATISDAQVRSLCVGPQVDISQCESLSSENEIDFCYYNAALTTKNPDVCSRIPGPSLKDNCFLALSQQLNNTQICDRITSENLRGVCTGGR